MRRWDSSLNAYVDVETVRRKSEDNVLVDAEAVTVWDNGNWRQVWPQYEQAVNYLMLYDRGDECTAITGGWMQYVKTVRPQAAEFYTSRAIDLSEYSVLLARGKHSGSHSSATVVYTSTPPALNVSTGGWSSTPNFINLFSWTAADTVASIKTGDISSVDVTTLAYAMFSNTDTYNHQITKNPTDLYLYAKEESVTGHYGNLYTLVALKDDNWQKWISKAGLSAASLDDVMANGAILTTLLSSWGATNYMLLQCSGTVMAAAIQSSAFLTALNNSPYKSEVYANPHWAKFLAMI